jgi:hypothetical protein
MKRYRDLREQLNEDSESYYDAKYRVGPLGGNNEVDQADSRIHDVAHPGTVRRINTYLGAAGAKPVLDPNSVLRQIQRKLSIIGLQFSIPSSDLQSRSRYGFDEKSLPVDTNDTNKTSEYPLTYMGGRFGVLDNSGKIGYDDGISHRLGHGLKLQVKFETAPNGMTSVMPKIVASESVGSLGSIGNAGDASTAFVPTSPKPVAGDSTVKDVEKENLKDDIKATLARLKQMTPGQNAVTEGSQTVSPLDPDRHPKRKGLEGPFRMKSGKVLYYDPKAQFHKEAPGKYYDASTDMFVPDTEVQAHQNPRK